MKLGPHSGLGTWTGARVAPLRSPILRPGGIGSNVSESVLQLVKEFSKQPRQRHRAVWRSIYRNGRACIAESWESCASMKNSQEGT